MIVTALVVVTANVLLEPHFVTTASALILNIVYFNCTCHNYLYLYLITTIPEPPAPPALGEDEDPPPPPPPVLSVPASAGSDPPIHH